MSTPETREHVSEHGRSLLRAWTNETAPSAGVRSRTWAAVHARAALGELGPELSEGSGALASGSVAKAGSLRLILVASSAVVIVGLVIVGLLAADRHPLRAESPSAVIDPKLASAPQLWVIPDPPQRPVEAEPELEVAPAVVPAPAPEARRTRTPSEPADPPDTLTMEMKLLGAARAALKVGSTDEALARLDEHAARFPKGALESEREFSRVTALCKAERLDEAERVAQRYAKAHPGGALTKKLEKTCVGDRLQTD